MKKQINRYRSRSKKSIIRMLQTDSYQHQLSSVSNVCMYVHSYVAMKVKIMDSETGQII